VLSAAGSCRRHFDGHSAVATTAAEVKYDLKPDCGRHMQVVTISVTGATAVFIGIILYCRYKRLMCY